MDIPEVVAKLMLHIESTLASWHAIGILTGINNKQ